MKKMTQLKKLNKTMATIIITLVANFLLAGCSSESPSDLTKVWLDAVVNKDKETIAKYLIFPSLSPEEELLRIDYVVEKLTEDELWEYEIKGEFISANKESAIVTVIVTTERDIKRDRDGERGKIFWVKTKNEGWKIDAEKMH
ncbi:MAG TPA: hypothetical protein P5564_05265 [Paludibacteraceae bacterium]|jgi:hypothetical protein|nr:hypothetical protein [Paludibacteraceae bacterium]HRS67998.1 hypothetical protein [Paludibacteraceae bacterium]